jgi:hypothetical protein
MSIQLQSQTLDLTVHRGSTCFAIKKDSGECVDEFRIVKRGDWLVNIQRIKMGHSEVYATLPRHMGFITCDYPSPILPNYGVLVAYTPHLPSMVYGRVVRVSKLVEAVCMIGDCRHPDSKSFKIAVRMLVPTISASKLSPEDFENLVRVLGSNPVVGILKAFRAGDCRALEYCIPF